MSLIAVKGNYAFDEFQDGLLTLGQIRGLPHQLLKVRQFTVEA
jgi:hypothetical protein